MSNLQKAQAEVKQRYDNLIVSINKFSVSLGELKGKNPELYEMQERILDELTEIIKEIKCKATEAAENILWDHLIIGFFGETNAGKSTIIETFRTLYDLNRNQNRDGLIVGDGRQDFTKDYNTYIIYIDRYKVSLVDVPGIEGNEKEFKDKIEDALRRVHIIFYVHGKNLLPDEGIAEKIKNYLSDWVKVYTIQNIIGRESKYLFEEDKACLVNTESEIVSSGVIEKFKKILGDNYIGNIAIQALIALCAQASFDKSREDLIKTQTKLLKSFGSKSAMLEFSRFKEVCNLIKEKADNFRAEIITANKKKIASISHRTYNYIYNNVNSNKTNIQNLKSRLKQFKRDVMDLQDNVKEQIRDQIEAKIRRTFSKIISSGYEYIENGGKNVKAELKNLINQNIWTLYNDLNRIQDELILQFENDISIKRKKLKGINLSLFDFPQFKIPHHNIPLEHLLYNLSLNLADITEIICSFGIKYKRVVQKRKSSAKDILRKNLHLAEKNYFELISKDIRRLSDIINEYANKIIKNVDVEIKRIELTENLINEIENELTLHILDNVN